MPRSLLRGFLLRWSRLLGSACVLLLSSHTARAFTPTDRSVSASGQFVVYCKDATVRVAVATVAEDTKRELLKMLRLDDGWKHPVVVEISDRAGDRDGKPPVEVRLVQTDEGLQVNVSIQMGPTAEEVSFRRETLRALLLELAYRGVDSMPAGRAYRSPPGWLVAGIDRLLGFRSEGVPAVVYQSILRAGNLPSAREFLAGWARAAGPETDPLQTIFAASFVRSLVDFSDGRERLVALLQALPAAAGDDYFLVAQCFPGLDGADNAFDKWWAINLARLARSDSSDMLPVDQTAGDLAGILEKPIVFSEGRGEKQSALDDFESYAGKSGARPELLQRMRDLIELKVRANPLHQAVIGEYIEVLGQLAAGKTRGAGERMREAAALRAGISRLGTSIVDYLNWIEGTQMGEESGAFDGYFRAAQAVEEADRPHPRNDPVGRYLDALESEIE